MSFNITPESATPAGVVTAGTTQTATGVIKLTKKSRGSPPSFVGLLTTAGEVFVFQPNGTLLYKVTVSPAPVDFDVSEDGFVITTDGSTIKLFDNTGSAVNTRTQTSSRVAVGITNVWWIVAPNTISFIARSNITGVATSFTGNTSAAFVATDFAATDGLVFVCDKNGTIACVAEAGHRTSGGFTNQGAVVAQWFNTGGLMQSAQFYTGGGGGEVADNVLLRSTFDLFTVFISCSFNYATGWGKQDGTVVTVTLADLLPTEFDFDDGLTTLTYVKGTTLRIYSVNASLAVTLSRTITLASTGSHLRLLDNGTYVLVVRGTAVEVYSTVTGTLLYTYTASQSDVPTFFTRQVQ